MVKQYENFLTEDECNFIIGLGESTSLKFGQIASNKVGYRKTRVCWLDETIPIIDSIKKRVSELSELPLENQENFHFVKYGPDGEYKKHHDGGDRPKTALIYLNDGFTGGETEFPKLGITVKPKTGKLIIWDNSSLDGVADETAIHAGLPVEVGTKYIGVIWIKNKKIK